jgi:hypothetical protein
MSVRPLSRVNTWADLEGRVGEAVGVTVGVVLVNAGVTITAMNTAERTKLRYISL